MFKAVLIAQRELYVCVSLYFCVGVTNQLRWYVIVSQVKGNVI